MNPTDDVRNVLEEKLLAAQEGHISSDELLEVLLQVFMPVQDEKSMALNIQRSTRARPLALSAEDSTTILVLFSSPERAKPFLQDYPGSEVGFDMEPETVNELARRVAEEASPDASPERLQ